MTSQGNMGDIYTSTGCSDKRRLFLRTLPPEHEALLSHKDRFIIQNASLLAGKGRKEYEKIKFKPQKPTTIAVFSYEGIDPITDRIRACIHAFALSLLYNQEWNDETNPVYSETLGSVISILASYKSYDSLKKSGLETALSRCHIAVEHTSWKTLNEVEKATKEVREEVAQLMKIDNFDDSPQACTIVALSILILIGKNVSEANRDGWFRNLWNALAHVSSVSIDAHRIEPPLLKPCQAIYSSLSTNQPVRSCIFKAMRTLSSIVEDQNHVIFDRIIRQLQWAEMSHIWMIMEYIFEQNPDLLNFPELSGPEIIPMTVAINFLKRYPKEERPYLKLLYDHNDLIPLHSNNLIYFNAAAHAVFSLTKTSMLNINARFSENVKAFQAKVISYMNAKSKVGPIASAISYTTILPSQVQKSLMKAIAEEGMSSDIPDFVDIQPSARE